MAETTIEWAHYTFNPWRGCTKVSEGCKHCYAETLSKRNPATLGEWGPKGRRAMAAESYWKLPVKWNAEAEKIGERRRVFCASLADVFEDRPELVEPRRRLFELIDQTKQLDWLLLTKRPYNIGNMLSDISNGSYPDTWNLRDHMPNVWIGTSVENQQTADERIVHLLRIPAKVRFLSCEPLLGPVDLGLMRVLKNGDYARFDYVPCEYCDAEGCCGCDQTGRRQVGPGIHQVIVGGESGKGARPMHLQHARALRDQCQEAGVAFLFKQWGEYAPGMNFPDCIPSGTVCACLECDVFGDDDQRPWLVGKKVAGRELDGRTWDEYPTPDRS